MKKSIILFLLIFSFGALSAQQLDETDKRALEREIKVSGNYLYGEAIGNTKDEAVKMAKTALASEINKEALNHPEWQFAKQIKATDVEAYCQLIDFMRGNKFRVIAYLKKNDNKTDDLLGQILKATSMLEVKKLLEENKPKGKVAYGTMDKLLAPENAYLIVYKRTGEIIAVLDKGNTANRKDLHPGEVKGSEISKDNEVIWFQIF